MSISNQSECTLKIEQMLAEDLKTLLDLGLITVKMDDDGHEIFHPEK